jgi:hypothetical protein
MKIAPLFVLLSFACLTTLTVAQEKSILEMPEIGLAFNYPKTWQVSPVKKSSDFKVLVPVEGSSQKATLELYNVAFNSEKDIWQLGQKAINERMKHEIMRQWEEEFLGVPMLLTKVSYSDKEGPQILMTGLIYSRTPKKLMFRLSASPDDFDKAEFAWREAMNTIRTGRAWTPEDPNLKPDPKAPTRATLPPAVVTKPNSLDTETKTTKPPVAIPITVSGKKLEFRMPGEWAGKLEEDGSLTLTHPELSTPVKVSIASSLDSDPAQRALLVASSKTLADFQKVAKRDETVPTKNRAGAMVAMVWRTGNDAKGDLFSCDASVMNGDFYSILKFSGTSAAKIGNERKLVENLLQNCTIQLVP